MDYLQGRVAYQSVLTLKWNRSTTALLKPSPKYSAKSLSKLAFNLLSRVADLPAPRDLRATSLRRYFQPLLRQMVL